MSGDAANTSGAPVALEFEIDGNVGELTVDAAGGTVRGASGELQLSAAEAWAAHARLREMIGALQCGGLQAATSAGDILDDAVALADTQNELWTKLGGAPLAVVMDTTT